MKRKKPKSYKEIVSIPEKLKEKLPTSYDVIGDILLLKLEDDLLEYKNEIGRSLIDTHKNIRTVCLIEPVSGEYRTRHVEVIAGENNTKTIHKEYGLRFYVDVEKTYFSPRLANERMRIAKFVKKDEIIVDMFTGVAPFPIMVAKKSNPRLIYAIDKNKYAIEYARKNVTNNKLLDKIGLFNINSRDIKLVLNDINNIDRIIMNHPTASFKFFQYALDIVSKKTVIHYYEILSEAKVDDRIKSLREIANKRKIIVEKIEINKIKSYSPHEFYICFDITAKKK